MKILHIGFYSTEKVYRDSLRMENPYFVAQFSYEKALCLKLKQLIKNIEYLTIVQPKRFPRSKLVYRNNKDKDFTMIGFINIPFLKEISMFISTINLIRLWCKKI